MARARRDCGPLFSQRPPCAHAPPARRHKDANNRSDAERPPGRYFAMTNIQWRAISALVLSVGLGVVFWLVPGLEPATFRATTPEATMVVFGALFAVFWLYLVVQGYPVAHGDVGTSSTHTLDNIISGLPAIVALFAIFI